MKTKGIDIVTDQAAMIVNEDTEKGYQTIIDQEIDSIRLFFTIVGFFLRRRLLVHTHHHCRSHLG